MSTHAATPSRVLYLARRIGLGGMTRQMAESAIGLAGMGVSVAILTTELPGLESFGPRFEATGVQIHRTDKLTRATIMPVVQAFKPHLVRLVSGTFPPNIALASRLMREGLPVIESLHAMTMRERLPAVRLFDAAVSPNLRYRAIALSEPMYRACLDRVPGLGPWLRRIDYGMPLPSYDGIPPRPPMTGRRPFRVFTAARLVEDHKDTTTLLRALAIALDELGQRDGARTHSAMELRIAGAGRDMKQLVRLADSLGIADRVAFLGWVADVRQEMRQADVFVLSTKSESFGRVNVEAAAAGTPVIASRVLGCLASVEENGNGLLVAPGDPQALADALLRLHDDDALRERFAQRGPAFATRFSLERHLRAVLELASTLHLKRWPGEGPLPSLGARDQAPR